MNLYEGCSDYHWLTHIENHKFLIQLFEYFYHFKEHIFTLESLVIIDNSENIVKCHKLPSPSFYNKLGRVGH